MAEPVVSIIVPFYNAESTLYRAVLSLSRQTIKSLQVVFINDYSTDNGLSKLESLQSLLSALDEVKIISHVENRGVAAARNTGLDYSTGEYIFFVDADDYIENNAIELLLIAAQENEAEIVGCNWFLTFSKNERAMSQRTFSTPLTAIQNILRGAMRWNLWLFMVKRSLYVTSGIRFIPGQNMGEDLYIMVSLFLTAKKVAHINNHLYHYWEGNPDSLTNNYSIKNIKEVNSNVEKTEQAILLSPYANTLSSEISFMKLNIKLPLLISDDENKYKQWLTWFPEANAVIWKNPNLSVRIKVLQYMALKKQYWAVKLYFYLIVKFVYGVLYK